MPRCEPVPQCVVEVGYEDCWQPIPKIYAHVSILDGFATVDDG